MFTTSSNDLPFKMFLIQGKRKKSLWAMVRAFALPVKCGVWLKTAAHVGLVMMNCHASYSHFLGNFWQTASGGS
jgi:hypothetical protein